MIKQIFRRKRRMTVKQVISLLESRKGLGKKSKLIRRLQIKPA